MGHGEVINSGRELFARINTAKAGNGQAEKLDAQEVAQAKQLGFSMFALKEGMTEDDFVYAYTDPELYGTKEQSEQMAKQERNIHVKYIQLQYNTQEEIQDGETIEQYEARVANKAKESSEQKGNVKNKAPQFGLEESPKSIHVIGQKDPDGKQPKEGDYAVKDDKTFKFTNGEWKEINTNNSPKASDIPENMPEGKEGDYAFRDGDTYKFRNGQWVKIKTQ